MMYRSIWNQAFLFLAIASVRSWRCLAQQEDVACDVGPDALTAYLSRIANDAAITAPQYCVPNPVDGGGRDRCYYLFVPECASGPTPLVMDMHGADACPLLAASYDHWAETAMKHCFAVFWPIGVTNPEIADTTCFHIPGGRNLSTTSFVTQPCCCHQNGAMLDNAATQDLLVVRTMIQDIFTEKRMDKQSDGTATMDATRIYMGGHANGCMGALGMGATYSDVVAAVCCHSGALLTQPPETYSPVPTWLVSGRRDQLVWPQLVDEASTYYMFVHNCSEKARVTPLDGGVMRSYETCTNNATVTLVSLDNSGHFPFYRASESSPGASMTEMDTTQMAWEFCSSYAKDEIPGEFTRSGHQADLSWGDAIVLAGLTTLLLTS
jgi:poly(3-hydroxybutyrate) depolymerase